jgi:hypothetical protein
MSQAEVWSHPTISAEKSKTIQELATYMLYMITSLSPPGANSVVEMAPPPRRRVPTKDGLRNELEYT